MPSPLRVSSLACAATALVLAGVAVGGLGAGDTIERSYSQVFDTIDEAQSSRPSSHGIDPAHIHLSRLPAGPTSPMLGVGDVITLAARAGGSVAYEVIEVRPLASDSGAAAPVSTAGLVMITAVTRQSVPQTIRFIVDAPADALPGLQPRAL